MSPHSRVEPANVHQVLSRHILADGFDIVLDLEKSRGAYLHDSRFGKTYLDFFTFFASNPLGSNHPKVTDDAAFRKRIADVAIHNPSNSDIYTTQMAEFVDTFERVAIPDYLPHAFFVAGGALAVENALKVAFDWKVQLNFKKGYRVEKGHKVLHLERAFHGRSGYTMSLTNTEPNKVVLFPKFDWPRISSPFMKFPQNDAAIADVAEREALAIAQAERYFQTYPDDIAAIILEPIQAEGGDNHFRPEFHIALRRLADQYDALLIYDEVQTGVGLTGKFWAHEHYVRPDIIAFGKKTQVCGILSSTRVDSIDTNVFRKSSRINSTWGGNLVDMVRFQRYLEIIEEDDLVGNAARTGSYLLKRIQEFEAAQPMVSNARGLGLMCAFDLPNTHARNAVVDAAFDNGLMILPCGTHAIRFRPPLTIHPDQIDEGMEILERSLAEAVDRCPVVKAHKPVALSHPEPKLD
jgi:L-lysine 6-transaminase